MRARLACRGKQQARVVCKENMRHVFEVQACSRQESCCHARVIILLLSDSRILPAGGPVASVPVIVISARPGISVPAQRPGASVTNSHIPVLIPAAPVPGIPVASRPAPAIPCAALAAIGLATLGLAAPVSAALSAPLSDFLRPPAASTRRVSVCGPTLCLQTWLRVSMAIFTSVPSTHR